MADQYSTEVGDIVMVAKTGEAVVVVQCWENATKFRVKFESGRKEVFKADELKYPK